MENTQSDLCPLGENSKQGMVFMVVNSGYNLCYIGCTKEKYLSRRMSQYRREYNKYINGKAKHNILFDLFDKYGLYNCKIELIRHVNYTTRSELKAKCIEDIDRREMCINNIQQHSMFKDSITKKAITNKCEYFKIFSDSEEEDD